jgi:hypothetical protein
LLPCATALSGWSFTFLNRRQSTSVPLPPERTPPVRWPTCLAPRNRSCGLLRASATTSQVSQSEKPAAQEKPAAEKKPDMSSGQKNALEAGQNYLDTMPFSKAGLIQQLSSSAGDGYSKADATFAANHVDADWNKEAVEAAKNYLDTMPMSKDALIEQLASSAGDKYTQAQARYAASKVY